MLAPRTHAAIRRCLVAAMSWLAGCGGSEPGPRFDEGRFAHADIAVLPEMLRGLKSKDASTRALSAATIGGMGPAASEAIPALIALLKDRETSVRAAGAHALGRMGPAAKQARPGLESLAKQAPLREVATKALEQIKAAE